jgi:hypothetical protein
MQTKQPIHTPWGAADYVHVVADGITEYSTPSHGGIGITQSRLMEMPPALRDGLWYEEDCAVAKVVVGLSKYFSDEQYAQAKTSLKTWFPDTYEEFFQEIIPEGESYVKDKRIFKERHKDDWVGIAALGDDEEMVRVTATKGGERACPENGFNHPEEREFAVPENEYQARGRNGFIVDPERHQDYNTWKKLATARSWKASALEALAETRDRLTMEGNIEGSYKKAKGMAVLDARADQWWASSIKRSSAPALLADEAALEWDITIHGAAKIPVPSETPFKLPCDDNLYHGVTAEPMPADYEGLVASVIEGETSIFSMRLNADGEREWAYQGTKSELESGGLCVYLNSIGPEDEAHFWALKEPKEAEEMLPEKKSAMPKM